MNNTVLTVIDMQACFVTRETNFQRAGTRKEGYQGYNEVIDNIAAEIKTAIKNNQYIIFVEFDLVAAHYQNDSLYYSLALNKTLTELTDLVNGYNNVVYVYKSHNDGATEIIKALNKYKIAHDNIKVCGVYADACVSQTVDSMSVKLKNSSIKVLRNAVAGFGGCSWNKASGLDYMSTMDNVSII